MPLARQVEKPEIYPLRAIKTREDYEAALESMEQIFDETGGPLAEYAETLGILIEYYEERHFPIKKASGAEVLNFLMEQNDLTAEDVSDIFGGEQAVSEILGREQPMNLHHIKLLAERFNVKPATFV